MLEGLFGNKNIQNVLFFLFVHGKCYGVQLQKQFQTALTPLQKALERLERAEIISSFYEGKTRVYHFNAAYPMLNELKALLKRGYYLLSQEEKMRISQRHNKTLDAIWDRLKGINKLSFRAISKSKIWQGSGSLEVVPQGEGVLLFYEKGSWLDPNGQAIDFTNLFRWTRHPESIALEHLRRGFDHPVFLFHLVVDSKNSLKSQDSYFCVQDCYSGKLACKGQELLLTWRIRGPKKHEDVQMRYT